MGRVAGGRRPSGQNNTRENIQDPIWLHTRAPEAFVKAIGAELGSACNGPCAQIHVNPYLYIYMYIVVPAGTVISIGSVAAMAILWKCHGSVMALTWRCHANAIWSTGKMHASSLPICLSDCSSFHLSIRPSIHPSDRQSL